MKQIRLKCLTIDNFKGQRHLQLDLGGRGAITSVEAVFSGIGRAVSLRKEYYEKWSAKRGSGEDGGH